MFRTSLYFVFLIAVFLSSGCPSKIKIFPTDDFTKEARSKYDATIAELEKNRRLWKESKIADYDFEIRYQTMAGCTCAPAAMKVREGQTISVEKIPKDFPGEIIPEPEQIETIDKIFDFLKQILDDDQIVDAKYNQKFGYPEEINITSSSAIDAKSFFHVTRFEIAK